MNEVINYSDILERTSIQNQIEDILLSFEKNCNNIPWLPCKMGLYLTMRTDDLMYSTFLAIYMYILVNAYDHLTQSTWPGLPN